MLLKHPSAACLENPLAGALVASLLVLAAPLRAEVVVERVGSEAAAGVVEGDVLVGWETVGTEPTRSGTFESWSDAELLDVEVTPLGPLRVRLRRDGELLSVELPPRELEIDARPLLTAEAMSRVEKILAEPGAEGAAAAVRSAVAGLPADVTSWAVARLAEARLETGNPSAAAEAYRAAAAAHGGRFAGELVRLAGEARLRAGELERAEALYRESLRIWKGHEAEGLGASRSLVSLGSLQAQRHDFEEAERTLAAACAIRERLAPASWLLAGCINGQGILHGRAGDLGLAEARFLEALEIRRRLGDEGSEMLANLAVVARLRGDLERARSYVEQALEIYRREDSPEKLSKQWNNLGNILADLGEYGPAAEAYKEALELLESIDPEGPAVANLQLNRAKSRILEGDLERAQADLSRARRILGFEEPRAPLEASVTLLEGEIAYRRGDLNRAVELLTRGLEAQARFRPDSVHEALGAAALAQAHAARGDRDQADALFRRAVRALERQQVRIGGGDRGLVAFRTKHAGIYRQYQDFLLESGRPDAAFQLYERSRAQGLRALLSGREIDWAADDLAELAPERDRLSREVESRYRELAGLEPEVEAKRQELRERIEKLHAERDGLSTRMYEASPRARRFEVPPAMDLATIGARLPKGILALAYSVGEEATTLFALEAGTDLEVHEVAVTRDALSRDVERWGRLVTRLRSRAELRMRSERLGRLLLGPVTDRIRGVTKILVIPDGALHSLPFAALPVPDDAAGRHLVELAPVERAASVSVYLSEVGDRPAAAPERVVALGDPATPAEAVARYRRGLGRLPAARLEAEALRREFGERSRILLGEEATEEAARRELPGSDLVHFACHAVVDEVLPMDSALVLTPSGEMSGLLHAWEIVEDLELQADLVVLSACQTARGGQRAGEGIVGLVRSLQIAGARNVLATLWNVHDESTAVLMERFYGYLAAGDPAPAALRRAQMDLIRGPVETMREGRTVSLRLDSPRYWAPFVLLGAAR